MREIILKKRYPHSREEDITDAFMRGYEKGKADRPQGEWKPLRGKYAECSVCEETYYMPHMRWSNFCPCCGAKMDGERKESE